MKVFHAEGLKEDSACDEVLSLIRCGGVIAYPTDTAYGLGADPSNEAGVAQIFHIKGRAELKPILLVVSSISMAESVSRPNQVFHEVASAFWPGPLTLIVPAASSLSTKVTAGTGTIGVRWPMSFAATRLVERFGKPITATSANRSGMPSAVTSDEVRVQLGASLDALIDGGQLPERGGSTLLDLTSDPPVLLREGPIYFSRLNEFFKGRLRRRVA